MIMNTPKTKSSPKPGVSLRIAEQEPAPPHSFTGSAEAGGSDALLQLGELQQQEAARVLLQPELVHPDGIDSCRARIPAEIVENIVSMAVQMARVRWRDVHAELLRVRWRDVHAELLYHTRASSSSPFIFFFFSSNLCTFCGYVHF
jgi:hypothetical protein